MDYRITFIIPNIPVVESVKSALEKMGLDYPVYLRSTGEAVELARELIPRGVKLIVSHGLTLENIRKELAIPAIDLPFSGLDALATATEEELTAIDDVGPITAKYIRRWMDSPQSQDLLARLKAAGLNMTCKEEMVDRRFAGMTFVLTGTLEKFTRDEAGEMIEKRGGKTSGSVSKKTTYVVAGENAGSKLQKAQQLGIPVLTEDGFLEFLK